MHMGAFFRGGVQSVVVRRVCSDEGLCCQLLSVLDLSGEEGLLCVICWCKGLKGSVSADSSSEGLGESLTVILWRFMA